METVEIKTRFGRETRRNAVLIVNPKSGNTRSLMTIAPAVEALSNAGYAAITFTTTGPGDATRIASEYGGDCDLLVLAGGDGTINEVIRGIMTVERDRRPCLGYIPMGSTNDFATALGLPKRVDLLIDNAVNGVPTPIDVGSFNGRHYAYLASFGAFTDISYSTTQESKNALGFLAYLGSGMNSIAHIRPNPVTVLINGEMITDEYAFAAVSNTPSVVGVINYTKQGTVDLNDGLFEVMLINYPENAIEVSRIAHALSTGDFDGCELMHRHTCSEVKFILDEPVDWMLDGERVEAGHEVTIKNIHSAVRIKLPAPEERRSVFGKAPIR
ncbi:MAG: YegS/Rv2252/BmrU family lipid kinase [Clostridia bacterium]|nr:YegS/Rv2252/BmrU family lipid kinase [Clostridia bacterium]MBR6428604.1 YegS/Rv2252/BmrU family lipid kinase [Clostridia bacterium]